MTRSKFTYTLNNELNRVEIVDLNEGMSVTNDAENVLTHICSVEGSKVKTMQFIYCDSEGYWDILVPRWDSMNCYYVDFVLGI
jgi:hypothetical protein